MTFLLTESSVEKVKALAKTMGPGKPDKQQAGRISNVAASINERPAPCPLSCFYYLECRDGCHQFHKLGADTRKGKKEDPETWRNSQGYMRDSAGEMGWPGRHLEGEGDGHRYLPNVKKVSVKSGPGHWAPESSCIETLQGPLVGYVVLL